MKIRCLSKLSLLTVALVMSLGISIAPLAQAATSNKLAPCAVKASKKDPKTLIKNESIGYKTVNQNDATLAEGTTQVVAPGHKGNRVITYTASYKKNKLTGCKHTGTKVSIQPANRVVAIGTYVAPAPKPAVVATPAPTPTPALTPAPTGCTNGTYVNSAGNTVCSPEAAPSAPAGATAQCGDGSYSFSQSRSGTCSHHGGVATWL
jgi:hypothetical protein